MDTALVVPKEHRRWAVACHLAAAGGLVVPWFGIALGPLIAWLVLRREHPSVDVHGREAVNFNLTTMVLIAAGSAIAWLFGSVVWFLPVALVTFWLACVVFASVKAGEGTLYRYPVTIRFLA
jgi:uncharacterized Tic20 family protein